MATKRLLALLLVIVLIPSAWAADRKFGDCPQGYDCGEIPADGQVFPPNAVTAHTVYASFVMELRENRTLALPTDFAVIAGYFAEVNNDTFAKQRECVVWFNGYNVDQRPDPDNFGWGAENAFPSDEDQPTAAGGGAPNHDESYQDYDFDRDVENCLPVFDITTITLPPPAYAVVVEAGDCDPSDGTDHRFRGHLDFVDPNGIYHEVQEYDYVCGWLGPGGLGTSAFSNLATLGAEPEGGQWSEWTGFGDQGGLVPNPFAVSPIMNDLFPYTFTDSANDDGCQVYETPADNQDLLGSGDAGNFDLGHKCNGTLQDLFTERMWMTPVHAVEQDPTILQPYNFALQIDTCAGLSIYDVPGKPAYGASNGYDLAQIYPGVPNGGMDEPTNAYMYHNKAYDAYYRLGLDAITAGFPVYDLCSDGSSFSFDDTPRGRAVHSGPPPGLGSSEVMRGNSYDFDPLSPTVGRHRTNCRHNDIRWPHNAFPPGPPAVGSDCYPEDHRTAQIDIYVYDTDPTGGLFGLNSNGLTGPSVYGGPGITNDADEYPPYGP